MKLPSFSFERKLWESDYKVVAGIDEVGRGSFAGPVVAGCVVFSPVTGHRSPVTNEVIINDSKKLTLLQRDNADKWIRQNALAWGIGQASVAEINKLGIVKATEKAFRRAIEAANTKLEDRRFQTSNISHHISFLLVDAFYIPYVTGLRRRNQRAIIKGDTKSISIAAASIVAKVYRDKVMTSLSKKSKFKKYGWEQNKGYGTTKHRQAIKRHGITRLHRRQFVRGLS